MTSSRLEITGASIVKKANEATFPDLLNGRSSFRHIRIDHDDRVKVIGTHSRPRDGQRLELHLKLIKK